MGRIDGAIAAFLLIAGGVVLGLHRHTTAPVQAQTPSPPIHKSDPEAVALWKRTIKAQDEMPLRARATLTFAASEGKPEQRQTVDVFEGAGGQFRLVYLTPDTVAGRVLLNDGVNLYQYEPTKKTLLKRPTQKRTGLLMQPDESALASRWLHLASGSEQVAGRPAQVLEIHAVSGGLREKRWVDVKTGRCLRVEQYVGSGKLSRRVDLDNIVLPYSPPVTVFKADFPASTRVLTSRADRTSDVETEARRLGLPVGTGGYKARSMVRGKGTAAPSQHFVYSDGVHAISVFVSESGEGTLRQQDGWREVPLGDAVTGFAHKGDDKGRAAIAWLRDGRRYVAVARLPLPQLITMARGLADVD